MITLIALILFYKVWSKNKDNDVIDFMFPASILIILSGIVDIVIIVVIKGT